MSSQRRYFHSFDAFRFFAFFLVFISHVPMPGYETLNLFQSSGGTGVTFFFVLSGFLISYLLLVEKRNATGIAFRKFMIRRVLRIWPLFYLMLGFAAATPWILNLIGLQPGNEGYEPNWIMSVFFLENYQMIITDSFPNTSPMRVMWSLCVEEHFYILWGLVFLLMPIKRTPWFIGVCLVIGNVSRYVFAARGWNDIDLLTNIDYFAFGTAMAYVLVEKPQWLDKIKRLKTPIHWLLIGLTLFLVFFYPNWNYPLWLPPLSLGLLFAYLLALTLADPPLIHISKKNRLSRLGLYTYGLYLYHTIVINLMLKLADRWAWNLADDPALMLGFFLICLVLTIWVSQASFYLFERPFIRMKRYFYPNDPARKSSGFASAGKSGEAV